MRSTVAQIITKDKVEHIPKDLIHFYSHNGIYLMIPLDMSDWNIEEVQKDFGRFQTIEEICTNKIDLSKHTQTVIEIIKKLNITTFLVEYEDDVGDLPALEFIQFIVKDGEVIKGSTLSNTDEEGYLYCETVLGYEELWGYPYRSYENAKKKYFKR